MRAQGETAVAQRHIGVDFDVVGARCTGYGQKLAHAIGILGADPLVADRQVNLVGVGLYRACCRRI